MFTPEEVTQMSGVLSEILQNDNEIRKAAEAKLNDAKRAQADKYALCLAAVIHPQQTQFAAGVKSLASVILRRNISTELDVADLDDQANNANLWGRMSVDARTQFKTIVLESLNEVSTFTKDLAQKLCSLAVEVQGAMYEQENKTIWQELLNQLFTFINDQAESKVNAALNIFNGLFSHIIDHLVQYKDDLMGIFQKTLDHSNLDVRLAALQATSNYLQIADRGDTKAFVPLLAPMTRVITSALAAEEETVLEDALIEFNELAEVEPSFFRPHFKELYEQLKPVLAQKDFANNTIRHQPMEFVVTLIERHPKLVKNDEDLLKDILDNLFKLMIDIDPDIDESWLKPREGFVNGEDEEEDNVSFGKTCVDRLVSCVGDAVMLPLIGTLVTNTIQNEDDWRFKHAGIMAFSQVGEYVNEPEKIAMMVPIIVQHLSHSNPKIRYAALHCIGQIADDMPKDFQKHYHAQVLPAIIATMNDQIPRVQAHACAAMTNFMEGSTKDIVLPVCKDVTSKLCDLIQNGISLVKENAVTALASMVEQIGEEFRPHFEETLRFLIGFLSTFGSPEYKQFRGQVIEAMTIISAAVGEDAFKPVADDVIKVMLMIQNTQLAEKDTQRLYLLSAWQRICLLMRSSFAPYLAEVLPSIFSMASLKPEMGIAGKDNLADLTDVLTEVTPSANAADADKAGRVNVVTDELEEKDVAIQMLQVFVDELESDFAQYVEPSAQIVLSFTDYNANDNIRSSCATLLPSLVKCAKTSKGVCPELHALGKKFTENLMAAMSKETETEVLISQVQAFKDIVEEVGAGFFSQDEVNFLSEKSIRIVDKSLERIEENEKIKNEAPEDEEDALDQEDIELINEENQNEYDLQLSAAELMGSLFKTHRDFVGNLVHQLRSKTLIDAFNSKVQKRLKFALFVLDDMVEHLGPSYFSPQDYQTIVQTVCSFTSHQSAALRQASSYGIGVIAQNSGDHFLSSAELCITSLKTVIDYQMTPKVQAKKVKQDQFHHARDNAIASVGKIIKYQNSYVKSNPEVASQIVAYWLSHLPITHDVEEAQVQFEFLSDLLIHEPQFVFQGDVNIAAQQLAKIFGVAFDDKFFKKDTNSQAKMAQAVKYLMDAAPAPVPESFKATCGNVLSEVHRNNVESAYRFSA